MNNDEEVKEIELWHIYCDKTYSQQEIKESFNKLGKFMKENIMSAKNLGWYKEKEKELIDIEELQEGYTLPHSLAAHKHWNIENRYLIQRLANERKALKAKLEWYKQNEIEPYGAIRGEGTAAECIFCAAPILYKGKTSFIIQNIDADGVAHSHSECSNITTKKWWQFWK